jgi:glutaredoxin
MSDHPEDARLAAARPLQVTLYSRPGCHLCDEAKAVMNPLLREFGAELREFNIDEDPEIAERYCWDIPVVFLGRHKAAKHKVDARQFRRQLEEAREEAQKQRN